MSEIEKLPTFEQRLLALYRHCSVSEKAMFSAGHSRYAVNGFTSDQIIRQLFTISSGILDTPGMGARIWNTYGFNVDDSLPDWIVEEARK